MNKARCNEQDYIDFLIATPKKYSCVEAAKVQLERTKMPGHEPFTCLLTRLEPGAEVLWQEAQSQVERRQGETSVGNEIVENFEALVKVATTQDEKTRYEDAFHLLRKSLVFDPKIREYLNGQEHYYDEYFRENCGTYPGHHR